MALFSAALLFSTPTLGAQRAYNEIMGEAQAAYTNENWSAFLTALEEAQSQRPWSLYLTRNRIFAHAILGDETAALGILQKLADRGLSVNPTGHEVLDQLKASDGYKTIAAEMAENELSVGQTCIFLADETNDLMPESIAVSPGRGVAFVGSIRTGRIVRFSGGARDTLVTLPGGIYGLERDGDILYATANSAPPFINEDEAPVAAAIYALSRDTGEIIHRNLVAEEGALLGDIEKTNIGLVASDSITPRLYLYRDEDEAPAIWLEDPRFVNLQGMAYDKRRRLLFVADYLAGIFSVDVETKEVRLIENVSDAHLGGIDGLYLHKGDLVGIQNGATPQRIVRISLDRKGRHAKRLEVLQRNLESWAEPTNGQVVGNILYYTATSNWPSYTGDGALKEGATPAPLSIMMAGLTKRANRHLDCLGTE